MKILHELYQIVFCILMLLSFLSCQETIPEPIAVTAVSLNAEAVEMTEGDQLELIATVSPNNAENKNVIWSSSNLSIASVDDGKVIALKAGKAKITVKTDDGGKTATCEVTVNAKVYPVTSVSLDRTSATLTEGDEITLIATVNPDNATNKNVTWSSSNLSVASVSNGKVTALKAGKAIITVKTDDGGKTATCEVTVNAKVSPVTSVSLDRTSVELTEGDEVTLTVTINPDNATNKNVTWSSSNPSVASVTNGKVTALKAGKATITVKTDDGGKTATCEVTVFAISVPVPEVVADPQPENTAFVHRAFLTQYTGTGCGYCPYMIKILRELMSEGTIPEKAVLAAVHSYKAGDPAYISAPKVQNYPYLTVDILNGYSYTSGAGVLRTLVDESLASDAKAGISVNPKLYDDGTLVLKVQVKASVAGDYRVGAWLLEDDLYGQQEDYDQIGRGAEPSYDIHENCVRLIDSRYGGEWAGVPVGTLQPGQTADKTFVMNVKSSWKQENLHLALIVSTPSGSRYEVCNAIDCPIDAPTPFEYQK